MQTLSIFTRQTSKFICFLLLFVTANLQAQHNTPTLNGSIAAGEYGSHLNSENQQVSGGTTWFMTWDATYLYIATSGSNINEAVIVYLDINPVVPVNGANNANGSVQGYNSYDGIYANLPFRADRVLYFKNGYGEIRSSDGSGYWGSQTAISSDISTSGGTLEMRISWAALGGMPTQFNWFGTKSFGSGSYAQIPTENPTGTGEVKYALYYNILNTANTTATKPFSTKSLAWYTARSGGGYQTGNGDAYSGAQPPKLHDLTLNTNDNNNATVIPSAAAGGQNGNRIFWAANLELTNNLYIGMNSALFTANGSIPTLTMNGNNGRITINGRIDTNQDFGSATAADATDMRFVFDGTTYLTANPDKQFCRFSDITINAGKSLLADAASGNTEFEVQQGSLDIRGTLDLYYDVTNRINLWTRGNWDAFANTYTMLSSVLPTTEPEFDGIYVGRRTTYYDASLAQTNPGRLLAGGTRAVKCHLKGNFANYSEFVPTNASGGTLDLIFDGSVTQYIKGNYQETRPQNSQTDAIAAIASSAFPNGTIPRTNFHHIEINNPAHVEFETYETFNISPKSTSVFNNIRYMISGELKLTNGYLKTRNSAACPTTLDFHILTLMNDATVANSSSASYVHGPIRWEMKNITLPHARTFPIGKGDAIFRAMTMNLSAQNKSTVVYTGELMGCTTGFALGIASANGRTTLPNTTGEEIVAVSSPRHWLLENDPDNLFADETFVLTNQLHYGADDVASTDNALKIRIIKNKNNDSQYYNEGATGGTIGGPGSATCDPITSLSAFSIGRIGTILPVKLLNFTGYRSEKINKLTWTTATELNNDRFEIERSADNKIWETIGFVRGNGTTNTEKTYLFTDKTAQNNLNYYRLNQIDLDGTAEYSKTITLLSENTENTFLITPNPVLNLANITLREPKGSTIIQVINTLGQVLITENIGLAQSYALEVANLPSGTYLIRLNNDSKVQTTRIIITH